MFDRFNEELSIIINKKRRSEKLQADKKTVEDILYKEKNKLQQLKESLQKEGKDIEKLEGFSLKGLMHTLMGNKEQKMEKEQEEYLAAKLKYDGCLQSVEALTKVHTKIKIELVELAGVDEEYNKFMSEKERLILQQNDKNTILLINLTEEATDLREDVKELQEAIYAGEVVLTETDNAIEQLSSARSWGAWDMVGGGLISTAIKHSRIDAAQETMVGLQQLLQTFYKELKDVDLHESNINIDIGSFLGFADYFLDGFFVDWMVQSRIVDSLNQTYDLKSRVESIVSRLKDSLQEKLSLIKSKEAEKVRLMEGL